MARTEPVKEVIYYPKQFSIEKMNDNRWHARATVRLSLWKLISQNGPVYNDGEYVVKHLKSISISQNRKEQLSIKASIYP